MRETLRKMTSLTVMSINILVFRLTGSCQESRFYIKGDLGGNLIAKTSVTALSMDPYSGLHVLNRGEVRFDPGEWAGCACGYQVIDWFATEAELGAAVNTLQTTKSLLQYNQAVIRDGTFANLPFLINVKLSYPDRAHWAPFIGAGLGASASILDADVVFARGVFNTYSRVSSRGVNVVFAYQAFAGIRYKLNEQMGLALEYRYLATEGTNWENSSITFGSIETHALSLAFTCRF